MGQLITPCEKNPTNSPIILYCIQCINIYCDNTDFSLSTLTTLVTEWQEWQPACKHNLYVTKSQNAKVSRCQRQFWALLIIGAAPNGCTWLAKCSILLVFYNNFTSTLTCCQSCKPLNSVEPRSSIRITTTRMSHGSYRAIFGYTIRLEISVYFLLQYELLIEQLSLMQSKIYIVLILLLALQ